MHGLDFVVAPCGTAHPWLHRSAMRTANILPTCPPARITSRSGAVVAICILLGLPLAAEARRSDLGPGVPRSIRSYDAVSGVVPEPVSPAKRRLGGGQQLRVAFEALGKQFDLELEPNDLFTPGAQDVWVGRENKRQTVRRDLLFKGRVTGDPGSWVRISLYAGALDGIIKTSDEMYFVEPLSRFEPSADADDMIIYRLSDT